MNLINIARNVFKDEISELENVSRRISESFIRAVDEICSSDGKVVVTGVGKSGIIGHKISATLSSTGTHSIFLNSAEALHGDLGIINDKDIVIAISNSGSTPEILKMIPSLKKIGCKLILITGNINGKLSNFFKIVLDSGVTKEVCPLNLAPTTSATVTMVLGDALTVALMKKKSFKPKNFALYHPGGALGRRLLTEVKDVMIKKELIAKCKLKDSLLLVIDGLTKNNYGIIFVYEEDKFIGIITDGDIRRSLNTLKDKFFIYKAKDIMTKKFLTINQNELATDALSILEKNNISSLPVLNDENLVGLVRFHDLYEIR